jgi:hypothetical protein
MDNMRKDYSHAGGQTGRLALGKGLTWGLIGGLFGTMLMDLVLMVSLLAAGLPVFTCFSIVGNTLARFFSIPGVEGPVVVLLGAAAHYLIGPGMGAIFGAAAARIDAFRIDTLKKGVGLAVAYVEILSQPLLATTPILLKMAAAETLLWYGASFVMHFIVGAVLGVIVGSKLRSAPRQEHPRFAFIPTAEIRGSR